jgi:signal transduction histidine kinase
MGVDNADDPRRLVSFQREGATVVVGFHASLLDDTADPRLVVVFQDITQVQKLRSERDRLLRIAAVADVLPAVLHEVKNPLAAVTTLVEVMLDAHADGEPPSVEEYLNDLHRVLGELRRMRLASTAWA